MGVGLTYLNLLMDNITHLVKLDWNACDVHLFLANFSLLEKDGVNRSTMN